MAPVADGPELGELRQRLRGRRDVVDLDAGDGEADDRAGGRHPVVLVAAPDAAVQGRGAISRPSSSSVTAPPSRDDLGRERGEPVGLVAAQVPDAGDAARRVGEGGERHDRGSELARRRQVEVDARDAGSSRMPTPPSTTSASPSRRTDRPEPRQERRELGAHLGRLGRPPVDR